MNGLESFPYEAVYAAYYKEALGEALLTPISIIFLSVILTAVVAFAVMMFLGHISKFSFFAILFFAAAFVAMFMSTVVPNERHKAASWDTNTELQEWVHKKYALPFTLGQLDTMNPLGVSVEPAGYEGEGLAVEGISYFFVNSGQGILLKGVETVDPKGVLEQLPD